MNAMYENIMSNHPSFTSVLLRCLPCVIYHEEQLRWQMHRIHGHEFSKLPIFFETEHNLLRALKSSVTMDPVDGIVHLGDIVMCTPIIEAEALEQGKKSAAHWAHMVIHGMLHLQGYDHEHSLDANKMEYRRSQTILEGSLYKRLFRFCQ